MSLLLNPIRWALGKALAAAFESSSSSSAERVTVESPFDPVQTSSSSTAGGARFKPKYVVPLRRPRNDAEAQALYNHMRTVAFWLDSIPFLGRNLPFNVGVDSLIGLIPGYGDLVGLLLALYMLLLIFLFGVPWLLIGYCAVNIFVDAFIGIVPILGDALDVAFKVSARRAPVSRLLLMYSHATTITGKPAQPEALRGPHDCTARRHSRWDLLPDLPALRPLHAARGARPNGRELLALARDFHAACTGSRGTRDEEPHFCAGTGERRRAVRPRVGEQTGRAGLPLLPRERVGQRAEKKSSA